MAEFTPSYLTFKFLFNQLEFCLNYGCVCVCVCVSISWIQVLYEEILGKSQVLCKLTNSIMIIPILQIQCQLENYFSGQ